MTSRSAQSKKATWRLHDISGASDATRRGSLQATFEFDSSSTDQELQKSSLSSGANVVAVQFLCDGSTLSGVDFDILSAGYRVSLIKRRTVTGMLFIYKLFKFTRNTIQALFLFLILLVHGVS